MLAKLLIYSSTICLLLTRELMKTNVCKTSLHSEHCAPGILWVRNVPSRFLYDRFLLKAKSSGELELALAASPVDHSEGG
jgi:hypothetical protein